MEKSKILLSFRKVNHYSAQKYLLKFKHHGVYQQFFFRIKSFRTDSVCFCSWDRDTVKRKMPKEAVVWKTAIRDSAGTLSEVIDAF